MTRFISKNFKKSFKTLALLGIVLQLTALFSPAVADGAEREAAASYLEAHFRVAEPYEDFPNLGRAGHMPRPFEAACSVGREKFLDFWQAHASSLPDETSVALKGGETASLTKDKIREELVGMLKNVCSFHPDVVWRHIEKPNYHRLQKHLEQVLNSRSGGRPWTVLTGKTTVTTLDDVVTQSFPFEGYAAIAFPWNATGSDIFSKSRNSQAGYDFCIKKESGFWSEVGRALTRESPYESQTGETVNMLALLLPDCAESLLIKQARFLPDSLVTVMDAFFYDVLVEAGKNLG